MFAPSISVPLAGLFVAACVVGAKGAAGRAQDSRVSPEVIVARRYMTPIGTLSEKQAITIASGKIQAIVPQEKIPQEKNVVHYGNAVVCPGLIDVRSLAGAYGNVVESAFPVDPGASAIDSLDFHHRDFRRAVASGITAALIAPTPGNVVAGACAVVKTGGKIRGRAGSVMRDDGPLVFGFGPATWKYDRAPTSRIGALTMIRSVMDKARNGSGHGRLRSFVAGELDAMVFCDAAIDVEGAIRVFGELLPHVSVVYTGDDYDVVQLLGESQVSAIVGPYSFSMSQRTLSMAAALADAGVEVALAGRMPIEGGLSLRRTASLAVRYGMDPASARRAITIAGAKVAGVSDRIGAIRAGMDADLVVFSDDPLRLDARVLAVYIDGIRIYNADQQLTMSAGGRDD